MNDIITNITFITPEQVIDNYMLIFREYIDAFCKISVNIPPPHYDCMFYVGINVINKVYVFTLMKYNTLQRANYYAQKAYVYFIEYMEQIHEHELSHAINHNDAILFIYNKTIFEMNETSPSSLSTHDKMRNIFSLQPNNQTLPNIEECMNALQHIHKYINCILYWENTMISTVERINICKHLLLSIIKHTDHIAITQRYLEYIRNITNMSFSEYYNFLTEVNTLFETTLLRRVNQIGEIIIAKCYVERDILCKKIKDNNMKELVHWLYDNNND